MIGVRHKIRHVRNRTRRGRRFRLNIHAPAVCCILPFLPTTLRRRRCANAKYPNPSTWPRLGFHDATSLRLPIPPTRMADISSHPRTSTTSPALHSSLATSTPLDDANIAEMRASPHTPGRNSHQLSTLGRWLHTRKSALQDATTIVHVFDMATILEYRHCIRPLE